MLNIPEGYTYIRCDQYTPEEFKQQYTNDKGHVSLNCIEYMLRNPKNIYNTDDMIAIHNMSLEHEVGSMLHLTGKNTTKRYRYGSDNFTYKL